MFGHVASSTPTRGEYFLFYSYAVFSGGPLLIALVSGAAAYNFEQVSAAEATSRVMKVLRSIFAAKGVDVPSPLQVMMSNPPTSLGHFGLCLFILLARHAEPLTKGYRISMNACRKCMKQTYPNCHMLTCSSTCTGL